MGAWSFGPFDNDSAQDFFEGLAHSDNQIEVIENTIAGLKCNEWKELDESSEIIVCAEILCSVFDRNISVIPEASFEIKEGIDRDSAKRLANECAVLVQSILVSSEIYDEMNDVGGEDFSNWVSYMEKLVVSLKSLSSQRH